MIETLLSGIIALIGVLTSSILFKSMNDLSPGKLKQFYKYFFATVAFTGTPYAIITFFDKLGMFPEPHDIINYAGMFFVGMFFILILLTSLKASDFGKDVSFGKEQERIKKAMEE